MLLAWKNTLGDIGAASSPFARKHGYFRGPRILAVMVWGFPCMKILFVSHVGKKGTGMLLVPGMVITIEPMINEGAGSALY